jgi:hypothetical protein
LAYNSNNDSRSLRLQADGFSPPSGNPHSPLAAPAAAVPVPPEAAPTPETVPEGPQSAAHARFSSCRWQQPAEEGNAAFCTHREVKPYAGTTGFDPGAWCPDCQYYKLRRAPKKRNPADEYTY